MVIVIGRSAFVSVLVLGTAALSARQAKPPGFPVWRLGVGRFVELLCLRELMKDVRLDHETDLGVCSVESGAVNEKGAKSNGQHQTGIRRAGKNKIKNAAMTKTKCTRLVHRSRILKKKSGESNSRCLL